MLRQRWVQLLGAVGLGAVLIGARVNSPAPVVPRAGAAGIAAPGVTVPALTGSEAQTHYFLHDTSVPNQSYQVDFDRRQGSITVQSLGAMTSLPDTMRIKLFTDPYNGRTVNLQAVSPPPGSAVLHQQTTYGGKYDPVNGPYVAFELQVPLSTGETKSLRAQMAADEQKTP